MHSISAAAMESPTSGPWGAYIRSISATVFALPTFEAAVNTNNSKIFYILDNSSGPYNETARRQFMGKELQGKRNLLLHEFGLGTTETATNHPSARNDPRR
jgi:hypothetical protein